MNACRRESSGVPPPNTPHRTASAVERGHWAPTRFCTRSGIRPAHVELAHFDIKQVKTIRLDEPEKLGEKLLHRILGTLG
jgi:hypothetical protein